MPSPTKKSPPNPYAKPYPNKSRKKKSSRQLSPANIPTPSKKKMATKKKEPTKVTPSRAATKPPPPPPDVPTLTVPTPKQQAGTHTTSPAINVTNDVATAIVEAANESAISEQVANDSLIAGIAAENEFDAALKHDLYFGGPEEQNVSIQTSSDKDKSATGTGISNLLVAAGKPDLETELELLSRVAAEEAFGSQPLSQPFSQLSQPAVAEQAKKLGSVAVARFDTNHPIPESITVPAVTADAATANATTANAPPITPQAGPFMPSPNDKYSGDCNLNMEEYLFNKEANVPTKEMQCDGCGLSFPEELLPFHTCNSNSAVKA